MLFCYSTNMEVLPWFCQDPAQICSDHQNLAIVLPRWEDGETRGVYAHGLGYGRSRPVGESRVATLLGLVGGSSRENEQV